MTKLAKLEELSPIQQKLQDAISKNQLQTVSTLLKSKEAKPVLAKPTWLFTTIIQAWKPTCEFGELDSEMLKLATAYVAPEETGAWYYINQKTHHLLYSGVADQKIRVVEQPKGSIQKFYVHLEALGITHLNKSLCGFYCRDGFGFFASPLVYRTIAQFILPMIIREEAPSPLIKLIDKQLTKDEHTIGNIRKFIKKLRDIKSEYGDQYINPDHIYILHLVGKKLLVTDVEKPAEPKPASSFSAFLKEFRQKVNALQMQDQKMLPLNLNSSSRLAKEIVAIGIQALDLALEKAVINAKSLKTSILDAISATLARSAFNTIQCRPVYDLIYKQVWYLEEKQLDSTQPYHPHLKHVIDELNLFKKNQLKDLAVYQALFKDPDSSDDLKQICTDMPFVAAHIGGFIKYEDEFYTEFNTLLDYLLLDSPVEKMDLKTELNSMEILPLPLFNIVAQYVGENYQPIYIFQYPERVSKNLEILVNAGAGINRVFYCRQSRDFFRHRRQFICDPQNLFNLLRGGRNGLTLSTHAQSLEYPEYRRFKYQTDSGHYDQFDSLVTGLIARFEAGAPYNQLIEDIALFYPVENTLSAHLHQRFRFNRAYFQSVGNLQDAQIKLFKELLIWGRLLSSGEGNRQEICKYINQVLVELSKYISLEDIPLPLRSFVEAVTAELRLRTVEKIFGRMGDKDISKALPRVYRASIKEKYALMAYVDQYQYGFYYSDIQSQDPDEVLSEPRSVTLMLTNEIEMLKFLFNSRPGESLLIKHSTQETLIDRLLWERYFSKDIKKTSKPNQEKQDLRMLDLLARRKAPINKVFDLKLLPKIMENQEAKAFFFEAYPLLLAATLNTTTMSLDTSGWHPDILSASKQFSSFSIQWQIDQPVLQKIKNLFVDCFCQNKLNQHSKLVYSDFNKTIAGLDKSASSEYTLELIAFLSRWLFLDPSKLSDPLFIVISFCLFQLTSQRQTNVNFLFPRAKEMPCKIGEYIYSFFSQPISAGSATPRLPSEVTRIILEYRDLPWGQRQHDESDQSTCSLM